MRFAAASFLQLSHDRLAKAVNGTRPRNLDQRHLATLARLEAHCGAGWNVKAHAAGFGALEVQRRIGLEKVIVRTDLDRPIAAVGDGQRQRFAALVELDFARFYEIFTGDHRYLIGSAPARGRGWGPRGTSPRP